MAEPISKRQLFRFGLRDIAKHIREGAKDATEEDAPVDETIWFRPPGAIQAEDEFLSACERCPHCVEACPHQAISLLGPAEGRKEGSPVLHPEKSPCHWCTDMPCIRACPTEALSFPKEEDITSLLPIGTAQIDQSACLLADGILCDTCATRCPTHIRAIRMNGRDPVINDALCTGCGICATYCEAEPGAIKIIPN